MSYQFLKRFVCLLFLFGCMLFMYSGQLNSVTPDMESKRDVNLTSESLYKTALAEADHFPVELDFHAHSGCVRYPRLYDLEYYNTYWQVMHGEKGLTAYLFGAYFDDRPKQPVVRILAVMNRVAPNVNLFCQMWYKNDTEVRTTLTTQFDLVWNNNYIKLKDTTFVGQLITCPLPKDEELPPISISLTKSKCGYPRNNLVVQNDRSSERKDFMVCVKGLDFPYDDLSIQLVQFIEANLMFGVDKIVFYDLEVHPNIRQVLNYYLQAGKIELHSVSLPAGMPNEPIVRHLYLKARHTEKIIQELIPYNDCFYKNIHKYRYILLLDIDEIFVPLQGNTYNDMIKDIQMQPHSTLYSRNKIFLQNSDVQYYNYFPTYLNMLQATSVALDYDKPYVLNVKTFFGTHDVLTLNNHQPYACLGHCRKMKIPEDKGQLNHYRKKCFWENRNKCNEWTKDYNVTMDFAFWKFKDEFVERTQRVIRDLELIL